MKFFLLCLFVLSSGVALAQELTSLSAILEKIQEKNGGLEAIQNVSSLSINGRIFENGNEYKFNLIKKRPHYFRMMREAGNSTHILTGFDGENFWRVIKQGSKIYSVDLKDSEIITFESYKDFDGRFLSVEGYRNLVEDFSLLGVERVGRIECYAIEFLSRENKNISYIDTQSFREVRLANISRNGGKEVVTTSNFSNYEKADPFWLSKNVQVMRDNEIVRRIEIDSYRMNLGIFNFMFEKPETTDEKSE